MVRRPSDQLSCSPSQGLGQACVWPCPNVHIDTIWPTEAIIISHSFSQLVCFSIALFFVLAAWRAPQDVCVLNSCASSEACVQGGQGKHNYAAFVRHAVILCTRTFLWAGLGKHETYVAQRMRPFSYSASQEPAQCSALGNQVLLSKGVPGNSLYQNGAL